MDSLPPTIELVVFDDAVIENVDAVVERLGLESRTVLINGVTHRLAWHTKWHALGTRKQRGGVQIRDQASFDEALEWCSGFVGKAIYFFDYQLKGVRMSVGEIRAG